MKEGVGFQNREKLVIKEMALWFRRATRRPLPKNKIQNKMFFVIRRALSLFGIEPKFSIPNFREMPKAKGYLSLEGKEGKFVPFALIR